MTALDQFVYRNVFSEKHSCVYVVKEGFGRSAHETVCHVYLCIFTVWKDFDLYKSEGTNINSAKDTLVRE